MGLCEFLLYITREGFLLSGLNLAEGFRGLQVVDFMVMLGMLCYFIKCYVGVMECYGIESGSGIVIKSITSVGEFLILWKDLWGRDSG